MKIKHLFFIAIALIVLTCWRISNPPLLLHGEQLVEVVHQGHRTSYTLPAQYAPDVVGLMLALSWVWFASSIPIVLTVNALGRKKPNFA